MKRELAIWLVCLMMFGAVQLMAHIPLGINYQGVARSADGSPLINQIIGIRIRITSGPNGSTDYVEEHHPETNEFGLFAVIVGQGQSSGNITDVDWAVGNKWLQIEIDSQDNNNYLLVGTQQMMSVPYALYAAKSGEVLTPGFGIDISNGQVNNILPDQIISLNGTGAANVTGSYPNFTINTTDNVDDADADPTNELVQTATLVGTNLEITDAGGTQIVDLSSLLQGTGTDSQTLSSTVISPDTRDLAITGGNNITLDVSDNDNNSSNEIQTLSIDVNDLNLTGGGTVDLSGYLDNTDTQNLTDVLAQGTDAGANNITNLADPTIAQDAATMNYVDSQDALDLDQNSTNEIQDLQIAANTLTITNNGSATPIDLSGYLDNTDTQNLNDVLAQGTDAGANNITNLADPTIAQDAATMNYVDSQDALDLDQNSTNEIQDLQIAANTLTITNNGSATPIDLSGYLDNTDTQNLTDVLGQGTDAGANKITNLADPTVVQDAATKNYVDTQDALDLDQDPANEIQTLSEVLTQDSDAGGLGITNLADPVNAGDAVNLGFLEAKDATDYAISVPILFSSVGAGDVSLDLSGFTLDKGGLITGSTITITEPGVYAVSVQGISPLAAGSDIDITINSAATPVLKGVNHYLGLYLFELVANDQIQIVVRFLGAETVTLQISVYKI